MEATIKTGMTKTAAIIENTIEVTIWKKIKICVSRPVHEMS